MKIPILSDESRESLITEIKENQGSQVYQRLLELVEDNPNLFDVMRHLADGFSTKEESDIAMLGMAAIVWIVEAELERVDLEKKYSI